MMATSRSQRFSREAIQPWLWVLAILLFGFGDTVTSVMVFRAGGAEGNVLLAHVLRLVGSSLWAFLALKLTASTGIIVASRIDARTELIASVATIAVGAYLVLQNLAALSAAR